MLPSSIPQAGAPLEEPLLGEPAQKKKVWLRWLTVGVAALGVSCLLALIKIEPRRTSSNATVLPPSASPTLPAARLRITNGCSSEPLWIAHFSFNKPFFDQDIRLEPLEVHDFNIPDEGLPSARFWAKAGCDASGGNCQIGQSGGPGESCPPTGCAPPVDSKFEATFGCIPGTEDCTHNPSDPTQPLDATDWWDVSQVDGWTLPYKVEVLGECDAPSVIDCSSLKLNQCPAKENLGPAVGDVSLQLKTQSGDAVAGCYSPCGKLTYSQQGQGYSYSPDSKEAQWYCCPTPPISPADCSSGPVERTAFVEAVHRLCPSVYAYAYDDGVGLAKCPAGVSYHVTFYCPA